MGSKGASLRLRGRVTPQGDDRHGGRRFASSLALAIGYGALCWILGFTPAVRAVDLDAARAQFLKSCGTCHSAAPGEPNRQGPNLYGVVGRRAGLQPDFAYSDALKGGRWVWDEATLDRFIEDPQQDHPGTVMPYAQHDPEKRTLVIAFLKQLSADASAAGKP